MNTCWNCHNRFIAEVEATLVVVKWLNRVKLYNLNCNCDYIFIHRVAYARTQQSTFRSLSQAATYSLVYHTRWKLHTVPYNAERQAGKLWIPIFSVWFGPDGNQARVARLSSRRSIHSVIDRYITGLDETS